MTNKFLLNLLGFNPDLTSRQPRVDSLSLVSRQSDLLTYLGRIAAILVLVLTLGIGNAWGDIVTFTTTSSGGFSNNSKTASGVTVTMRNGTSTKTSWQDGHVRVYTGGGVTFSSTVPITRIEFTCTANKGSDYGPDKQKLADGISGSSYSTTNKSAVGVWTYANGAKSIVFNATAQIRFTQIVVTTADSYTVTWTINPAAGGTLSATSGNSTTVSPNAAYTYGSPAYTVTPTGKANVSQDGDNFTATPSANCTIQINMVEKTPATVTLMDNDAILTEVSAGAGVTLPSREGCTGYAFAGWTKSWVTAQTSWTTTAPDIIPAGSYTPAGNENLYPVYTKTEGGGNAFSNYSQVALNGTITDGKYLISTGSYTMAGSGKTGASFTPGTTEATDKEYTITTLGNGVFTIKGPDDKYVGGTSGSTTLSFSTSTPSDNNYKWKYNDKGINFQGQTTRYIQANGTTDFRNYAGSGTTTYLYKRIESGGSTTSYISVPNCCTPLGSINGSF